MVLKQKKSTKKEIPVDRYRDIYHPDIEEGGVISRIEAAHHILDIIKKMGINWDRVIKALPGWEGSL